MMHGQNHIKLLLYLRRSGFKNHKVAAKALEKSLRILFWV